MVFQVSAQYPIQIIPPMPTNGSYIIIYASICMYTNVFIP